MIDLGRLGQTLLDTARLDVQDCSYLYQPHNLRFTLRSHVGVPRPAQALRVASYLSHMVRSAGPYLESMLRQRGSDKGEGAALFVAYSHNQREALEPVFARVEQAAWLELRPMPMSRCPSCRPTWPRCPSCPWWWRATSRPAARHGGPFATPLTSTG